MYALIADEYEYLADEGCTEDHEHSWCERPSYTLSVSPVSLHRERRDFYTRGFENVSPESVVYECEDVPVGSTAYVVICEYRDGDTFGYSGYWCVAGVYASYEQARVCRDRCSGENDTEKAYRPWDGYFST